jgi:hypothetical protein
MNECTFPDCDCDGVQQCRVAIYEEREYLRQRNRPAHQQKRPARLGLWARMAAIFARAARTGKDGGPVMCDECGIHPADQPSKLCPGCEAYREHQA